MLVSQAGQVWEERMICDHQRYAIRCLPLSVLPALFSRDTPRTTDFSINVPGSIPSPEQMLPHCADVATEVGLF